MKKNIAIFLLFLFGSGVMSQSCHQLGEECDDDVACCAGAGVCKGNDYGPPTCICLTDSWWSSCSDSSECCGSKCNTRGYCGCISSGFWCTSGHSDECCGSPSSIDGHLIKTCTAAFPVHYECY